MSQRRLPLRALIWLGLLLIFLITLQNLPIGQRLNLGMSPLLSALHSPARWWQETSLWFVENNKLHSDYQHTLAELERQASLAQELNSLREENRQLRNLLGIEQLKGYQWVATKVLGRSPDKMGQRLILLVENARVDDVIVSSDGLVGLVDEAKSDSAVVRTILDASLAVPVTIPGTALAALVRGEGDKLIVDFVPADQAPQAGDVLQTSGAGGIFPPGLSVARVTRVTPVPGQVFVHIDASPTAHWQSANWLAMASSATNKSTP